MVNAQSKMWCPTLVSFTRYAAAPAQIEKLAWDTGLKKGTGLPAMLIKLSLKL
jgi:hypothetical protein